MKKLIENLMLGILTVAVLAALPNITPAQSTRTEPPARPERPPRVAKYWKVKPMLGGDTSERSIKVDGNVNLSLCVTQGTIKVNGWNRSEVRVFVQDGSKFGFKVQLKSPKT